MALLAVHPTAVPANALATTPASSRVVKVVTVAITAMLAAVMMVTAVRHLAGLTAHVLKAIAQVPVATVLHVAHVPLLKR